jgi:TetR/AcrR family transcriptional regulator
MQKASNQGRNTIRAAAINLFAKKGFAATSTREICEQAGVTKPVLYYYFRNKEQLYTDLISEAFGEYIRELEEAASVQALFPEKSRRLITTVFRFCRAHPESMWLAFRMVFAPENESPMINFVEMAEADERLATRMAAEGIQNGEIGGDAAEVANALIGLTRFYVMSYLVTGQPDLDELLASRIVRLIVNGCHTPNGNL